MASQPQGTHWLTQNGPKELEQLFRSIVYHRYAPVLIADDQGNCRDASIGASKLLGLTRTQIIGRQLSEFAQHACKPRVSQLWKALEVQGEQVAAGARAGFTAGRRRNRPRLHSDRHFGSAACRYRRRRHGAIRSRQAERRSALDHALGCGQSGERREVSGGAEGEWGGERR